jgi:hypothetical protein
MFASDLSGRQDWIPELRRPEGLRCVRQGFQPQNAPRLQTHLEAQAFIPASIHFGND